MDQDEICCLGLVVSFLEGLFFGTHVVLHRLFAQVVCTGCFAQVVCTGCFAQVVLHRLFCTGCFAQVGSLVHRLFAQVVLEPWRLGVGVRGQARANTQRQCTAAAESSSTTGTHSAA